MANEGGAGWICNQDSAIRSSRWRWFLTNGVEGKLSLEDEAELKNNEGGTGLLNNQDGARL